ncbi:hypothetical protein AALP_AA5G226000 [Arabis alpina]|uniref:FBD domain-containing protein n=1 Tax=Arabis alpina TaxID=50452 RepID=A0A087GYT6_ARAAL|nr:hypothetical protein AALP_AA5G226000 [Arabis alpina]
MGRISDLPNELICHIGSFLSAKEAALTMVLSKRWRNLFTIIQKLHFDDDDDEGSGSFDVFVDGVLALPVSSRVKEFSLRLKNAHYDCINSCLCNVLKRGVLVLNLCIQVADQGGYSLPLEVFNCKTVAKMSLEHGFVIDLLPVDAFLPALKTLFLDNVRFYDFGGRCAFKTLLAASPVLEELCIYGIELERWKWSCSVSSPTLQCLTIKRRQWTHYNEDNGLDTRGLAYDFDSISLDLPGLTYLEYSDYVPKEYIIVNLSSLVEAKLHLCVDEDRTWDNRDANDFNPMNLINGFKNVQILDVSHEVMEMLYVFQEVIPLFEKLVHITVSFSNCWFSLPVLIEKSPNLNTLVINNFLHYPRQGDRLVCQCVSDYSFLLSCPVKILEITKYRGTRGELEQMKHFLEKLLCLERVVVHAWVRGEAKMKLEADFQMLPKASSKCKIEYY